MAAGDGLDKLRRARAALLPLAELGRLADLRTRPDVRVVLAQRSAWVTWPAEAADLAMRMLAVPAAQLYEPRGDHWHALGHALPDFAVPPPGEAIPLAQGIVPAPLVAVRPTDTPDPPGQVRLVRSQQPRDARLLCVTLAAVQQWLDHEPITAAELGRLHACRVESMLWVAARHSALPLIEGAQRFWGETVFAPLGYQIEPAWPEATLRQALGTAADEWLIVTETGCQTLPVSAFAPLARYGVARQLANLCSTEDE